MKFAKAVSIVFLFTLTAAHAAMVEKSETAAASAAQAWLGRVDANNSALSWNEASTLFRERMSQSEWKSTILRARHYLGPLRRRNLQSAAYELTVHGLPDGEYVIVKFLADFAQFQSVIETVVAKKDADGMWRVADYYIAPEGKAGPCTGSRLDCN
jgi:hypothetical protein